MERFSSSPQSKKPAAQKAPTESFSEMANVTTQKSGFIGKLLVISLIVVSIAVTAFVGVAIFNGTESEADQIKSEQYQAVFLSDGQIYFGKITDLGEETVVLEDIYYLQVDQQVQPVQGQDGEDQQAQPQVSLAKLGNELHGPEDKMFITRAQMLFWENLKDDGQVTTAITNYVNEQGNDN